MLSLYCLAFADMGALVHEYFINTVRTMMGCVNVLSGEHGLLSIIHREMYTVALWIGVALFSFKNKRYAWILLCYMWFRLCFGGTVRQYYFTILTPFALFFPIVTLPYVVNRLPLLQRYIPVCCVLSAMVALVNLRYINRIYRNAAEDRVEYYKALYVMAQVEKPKIWCGRHDYGIGTAVDALPACKYWAGQNGATVEMKQDREQALVEGKADFVLYPLSASSRATDEEFFHKMGTLGYKRYATIVSERTDRSRTVVFGRPGLRLPPADFKVSDWDIYLKRNIFGI